MISPFDIVLILIGLSAVIIGAVSRYVRAIILLIGTYLASVFAGYLYPLFAKMFSALGHGTAWFDALSFTLFFVGGLLAIYFLSRRYFPDTTLPKLGTLDNLLGALVGLILALLWMAITYGTLNLMVSRPWDPQVNYYHLFNLINLAHLGPFLRTVLKAYAWLFKPFSWQLGLPAIFVP